MRQDARHFGIGDKQVEDCPVGAHGEDVDITAGLGASPEAAYRLQVETGPLRMQPVKQGLHGGGGLGDQVASGVLLALG